MRFAKDEIKAAYPVSVNFNQCKNIRYSKKSELDAGKFFPDRVFTEYDSLGNPFLSKETDPLKIDTATFNMVMTTEILFIESGLLKNYVPWITAAIPVKTSLGVFLGYSDYFSTCFNIDRHYTAFAKTKVLYLKQTSRLIFLDSINPVFKLKELYGRNLLQTLWPSILKNKFEIISLKRNKTINAKQLNTDIITDVVPGVPMYDSLGNPAGSKSLNQELSAADFNSIELVQDWYYDYTKNIVFNKIKELYLYANKLTYDYSDQKTTPVLKIVLNK